MPVRVKKLAAELNVQPQRVLEWLRETGFPQYANETDMVVDLAADKVRKAARKALKVGPAVPRGEPAAPARRADLLDQMIAQAGGTPDLPLAILARSASGVDGHAERELEVQRAAGQVRAEQGRLQAALREVESLKLALAARADELDRARSALAMEADRLRADYAAREAALEERSQALEASALAAGVPLTVLFERRGLRGLDEVSRALSALARARLLDPLLARLRVTDPEPVSALFRDRLLLAASAVDLDGVAVVQVPADRAEVAGDEELANARLSLSSEFLLSGFRKVRVIGGPPLLVRSLRTGLDPRLDVQFLAARSRDDQDARRDVAEVDVVVLWRVEVEPAAAQTYRSGRAVVVWVSESTVRGLIDAVRRALIGDLTPDPLDQPGGSP